MSFSEKFDLLNSHLFIFFFQIRHFIWNQNPKFPSCPPETLVDSLMALDPEQIKSLNPLLPITTKVMQMVFAFTTQLARQLTLLNWKNAQPPSHNRWVKELLISIRPEKLDFTDLACS